ncbi:MAG: Fe2+-dependent dioxygenase [Sphingomonas sp.]
MLHIPRLLDAGRCRLVRDILAEADWIDGRATAGHLSHRVKDNSQLREGDPAAVAAGRLVLEALEANPLFISAALPARIVPPLFNRYRQGQTYGPHIDGAIRPVGDAGRVRTDLAATLFLAAPEEYGGGELCVRDASGEHGIKLPAGDMILYPASSIHYVAPVTGGERIAAFFWIQSIVRDTIRRTMLHELDEAIQAATAALGEHDCLLALTAHYHNLLRQWADV